MDLGQFLFKYRSFTPIPLIIAVLVLSCPTWISFAAGCALILLGEGMRFWGVLYAGSATRTTGEVGAGRLVTDGPFAHVRNPLYLGNFMLSTGLLVMAWAWMPWMLLLFWMLFYLQYASIVRNEESFLKQKFPGGYEKYRTHVPRWLPSWKGFTCTERSRPVFKKALRSEKNTLQAILTVLILILIRWHLL